jgi:hypothetical protein
MMKLWRLAALWPALAVSMPPAAAAGTAGGGVAIAVGPRHPATASLLLGGAAIAPTVHKRKADFGALSSTMRHGGIEGGGGDRPGGLQGAGPAQDRHGEGEAPRGGSIDGG